MRYGSFKALLILLNQWALDPVYRAWGQLLSGPCVQSVGTTHRLIKTQIGHARDFAWYRGQHPSPACVILSHERVQIHAHENLCSYVTIVRHFKHARRGRALAAISGKVPSVSGGGTTTQWALDPVYRAWGQLLNGPLTLCTDRGDNCSVGPWPCVQSTGTAAQWALDPVYRARRQLLMRVCQKFMT